mmetsp:Transcript_60182/g.143449  ORF Transcript_60182/g.143449 Transcript_60182/m.143449 type:complete len:213 (+) Transcript_60182:2065-2703(+)
MSSVSKQPRFSTKSLSYNHRTPSRWYGRKQAAICSGSSTPPGSGRGPSDHLCPKPLSGPAKAAKLGRCRSCLLPGGGEAVWRDPAAATASCMAATASRISLSAASSPAAADDDDAFPCATGATLLLTVGSTGCSEASMLSLGAPKIAGGAEDDDARDEASSGVAIISSASPAGTPVGMATPLVPRRRTRLASSLSDPLLSGSSRPVARNCGG